MSQNCKFCGSNMRGEFETIGNSHHYKFFYMCPKCKAVFEGERKEQKGKIFFDKARWFNPKTGNFEG